MSAASRFHRIVFSLGLSTCVLGAAQAVPVTASAYSNYVPGDANVNYHNPSVAPGALTPDTGAGNGGLTPFNPAFSPTQIAWVGGGGSLTLQLSAPVPANGINLGIYSNVGLQDASGNGTGTAASPPTTIGKVSRATVSVSQDGTNFVPLNSGQPINFSNPANWFTDTAITNGFQPVTGTQHASQSKPFLGGIGSLAGQTYSQIKTTLNNSAGGTWLDLRGTNLTAVDYVKFNVAAGDRMIVDAVGGLGAVNAATLTSGSRVISESVGAGSHTSDVVVDFGPQSYDFKVHYDGSISGEQAMTLLQNNSDFRYQAITDPTYGDYLNGIDYGGYQHAGYDASSGAYWNYYLGDGTTWTYSQVGFQTRMLTDGSYDGWVWTGDPARTPNFAIVPEPASVFAVGIIGLLFTRRRAN